MKTICNGSQFSTLNRNTCRRRLQEGAILASVVLLSSCGKGASHSASAHSVSPVSQDATAATDPIIYTSMVNYRGIWDASVYVELYPNYTPSSYSITAVCNGVSPDYVIATYTSPTQINAAIPASATDRMCQFSIPSAKGGSPYSYTIRIPAVQSSTSGSSSLPLPTAASNTPVVNSVSSIQGNSATQGPVVQLNGSFPGKILAVYASCFTGTPPITSSVTIVPGSATSGSVQVALTANPYPRSCQFSVQVEANGSSQWSLLTSVK